VVLELEQALPKDAIRLKPEELARVKLEKYLDGYLERRDGEAAAQRPGLLILDQFEDLLTQDRYDTEAKEAFFKELGRDLANRKRAALFTIREDYLAALSPFARHVPTGLQHTFRMDLLTEGQALEAIEGPARERGVEFEKGLAEKLVNDLRQVRVRDSAGNTKVEKGPHVEPVHLQVLCRDLWKRKPSEAKIIQASLVEKTWNVDDALADFYDDEVDKVSRGTGVPERFIREWVERELITEDGVRGQVMQPKKWERGMEQEALDALVDAHLVRKEVRRDIPWYELTHDRMVAPVRQDNRRWQQDNLQPFMLQALQWDKEKGDKRRLLLSDKELQRAEAWLAQNEQVLDSVEETFLSASCEEAQARAKEQERALQQERQELEAQQNQQKLENQLQLNKVTLKSRRRLRLMLVVVLVFLVLCILAAIGLNQLHDESLKQWATLLVANAEAELDEEPLLGTLLLIDMEEQMLYTERDRSDAAIQLPPGACTAALGLLGKTIPLLTFPRCGTGKPISRFGNKGKWVVMACGPTVQIHSADTGEQLHRQALDRGERIIQLKTSGDAKTVALVTEDGGLSFWNLASDEIDETDLGVSGITAAQFEPGADGLYVMTKAGSLWHKSLKGEPAQCLSSKDLGGAPAKVEALSISPNGERLALLFKDGRVLILTPQQPEKTAACKLSDSHGVGPAKSQVKGIRFSPDGKQLLTYSHHQVCTWSSSTCEQTSCTNEVNSRTITTVYLQKRGRLFIGTKSGELVGWKTWVKDLSTELDYSLHRHDSAVKYIDFHGDRLLTMAPSGETFIWPTAAPKPLVDTPSEEEIKGVKEVLAQSPDWRLSSDGSLRIEIRNGMAMLINKAKENERSELKHQIRPVALASFIGQNDVALGTEDGTIYIFTLEEGGWPEEEDKVQKIKLRGLKTPIQWMTASSDSELLLTITRGGVARVWRTRNGERWVTLSDAGQQVIRAAFGPGKDPDAPTKRCNAPDNSCACIPPKPIFVKLKDNTYRSWPTSWSYLICKLKQRTKACLPPLRRMQNLAEEWEEAIEWYRACEVEHNRSADSDGDGTPDSQDKCPNTKGTSAGDLDEDGCPDKESSTTRGR